MVAELWTDDELRAAVAAYREMMRDDARGAEYSKSEVRRQLQSGPLADRSDGSIEYRMQNVSHVLHSMNHPWLRGYPPARNVGDGIAGKLRAILSEQNERAVVEPRLLHEVVPSADLLMGVKAVFGRM